jgi:hypothetical protein
MDVNPTTSPASVAPTSTYSAEQSPATLASNEIRQRIVERICALSRRVQAPALWSRFGTTSFVRRLSCQPPELLSQLVQQFTPDQLLAARVAVRTPSGELEASTLLAAEDAFLVRGDATGHAAGDIVSQRGKLSNGIREWRELAAQIADGNSAPETRIVLCASDAELSVLVRLGISCTPMAGADQLTEKQVRALFKTRPQYTQQRRNQLVLLGWQPDLFRSEPSARNLAAIRHVAAVRRLYGFDPHMVFSVWLPNEAEMARSHVAHSFVDRKLVANELKLSLQNSVYAPDDALERIADRKPISWSQAQRRLLSVVERSTIVARASETSIALKTLERTFREQVLGQSESTSIKKGWLQLGSMIEADLAEQWFEELEVVKAARRVVVGAFPRYGARLDDAALKRKLQLVDRILKLRTSELRKIPKSVK